MSTIDKEVNLIKMQNAPIKHLVFSGGGAKGAAYSGVFEGLCENNIMNNVECIAGSSAGSIIGALISTGIKPNNLKKLLAETDLSSLLGNGIISRGNAEGLYDLMHTNIKTNIQNFFSNNTDLELLKEIQIKKINLEINSNQLIITSEDIDITLEDKEFLKFQTEVLHNKLQDLRDDANFNKLSDLKQKMNQDSIKISFGDLKILRLFDPETFKDLSVTAVNVNTGELEIFNESNSPNVEIAKACQASSAHPLAVVPIKIEDAFYSDGGVMDNIPIKYFNKFAIDENSKEMLQEEHRFLNSKYNRKFIFAFGDNNSSIHSVLYNGSGKSIDKLNFLIKYLIDFVIEILTNVKNYSKITEENYQNLKSEALNVTAIDTKNIGTFSFAKAKQEAEYLNVKGKISLLNNLTNQNIITENKNLYYQNFFLALYEDIKANNGTNVIKTLEPNLTDLLALIAKESISTSQIDFEQKLLKDYLKILSNNAPIKQSLTKMVNAQDCSLYIKENLLALIQPKEFDDMKQNASLNKEFIANYNNAIRNYKFSNTQVSSILKVRSNAQNLAPLK
jgi:NTE family protein